MKNKEKIICIQLLRSRVFVHCSTDLHLYVFKAHAVEIFKETFGVAHAV